MPTRLRGLALASAGCAVATAGLLAPAASAGAAEPTTGDRVVNAAAAQAGKPYAPGGTGPGSFDCSGLAQYAYRQAGVGLPRTASQQRGATRTLSHADARPGDLIFFSTGGRVYHVGVFAGGNRMWAAPESGDVVRLQDIWTSSYTVGRGW
ncbi:C40 family peptidase [Amycolatopsis acidiphila]|uniref:C40 family peptidase n=1 Tax=Amycolatopsis acidiphila TaxID=715473 RepID=UPI001990B7D9|nr:C40 family peptidase [Amycolatopsis acidiphila]UIJ62974.1 C40 family peptidase [Amycolatopsis acidiphila]GHG65389.1 glycoside hydrolase [Amycolatopsis acidiphila]